MAPATLSLAVRPSGTPYLIEGDNAEAAIETAVASRVRAAFDRGSFDGILHLGAVETTTSLPPSLAFARAYGKMFMTAVCGVSDLEEQRDRINPAFPSTEVASLRETAPPMTGAEYLTIEVLRTWWGGMTDALRGHFADHRGPVQELLRRWNPVWNLVGRVWFHLAENKKHPSAPFAFMATYTSRVSDQARPQHIALGRAMTEYAGKDARQTLLALLAPLQRAAQQSELMRRLLDSGEVFHPLAWSARETLVFLRDIPAFETAGVLVRVPDWWSARKPARPSVKVTLGSRSPAGIGMQAMLDFSVALCLDGEAISPKEWEAIGQSSDGLVLLKGRWVEVDRDKLAAVLDHFKRMQKDAGRAGITFLEAMRLLGTQGRDETADGESGLADWSQIDAGDWLSRVLDRLRAPDGVEQVDPGIGLNAILRPYQTVGVRWLWMLTSLGLGGCLADDMGLGKTLQVIALLLLLRRNPERRANLLVAPASLIANWKAEILRFAPSLRIVVAHGSADASERAIERPDNLDEMDLVMTTYGSLHRIEWLIRQEWGVLVLDEAQAIKNPGARQTRAAKAIRARTRLCLTGTPIENRLTDLWSMFDFLLPGLLGTGSQFGQLTRRLERTGGYGPLRKLVSPYILRRLKTDPNVISDLPDKTEVIAWCSLTKTQAVLYQESVDALRATLDEAEGMQRRGTILAFLMRLKQICNHPSQWLGDGQYDPRASGKLLRLRDIAEQVAARQEKMIVFTQFKEMTAPLATFLSGLFGHPGLVLHGQVPVRNRKALVDAFQRDDGPPFFVLSLKAGGSGLNLTAASHVVHFDRWWNPAVENQATDRAFRIGQKRNVLVHKLACRGTVEERIDALINSKKELADQIVAGGSETMLTEMSNEELLRMVSLDVSAIGDDD